VRLKLDENLSRAIAATLAEHGHDVDTVPDEGLAGGTDTQVAQAARDADRMLVTLDRDFADVREYPPGTHPGIIVVRVDPPRPSWVKAALTGLLAHHRLEDLRGCLVIVQLGAARIRRPPS
jgi:predicted nuclease of predicted toxin-antitoxin system